MKDFVKQNWYWIGIIIVLISALFSRCNNDSVSAKNAHTDEYKTVTTKKVF